MVLRNKHANARKNLLFQRCLMSVVFLVLSSSSPKGAAQSDSLESTSSLNHSSSSNQSNSNLAQQNPDNTQLIRAQLDVNKEIEIKEKVLEKEVKQSCEISSNLLNVKIKKCEPSIYEQAYPGIDFQMQDEKIVNELTKELQKDSRFQNRAIVK